MKTDKPIVTDRWAVLVMLILAAIVTGIFGSQVVQYYRGEKTLGQVVSIDHHTVALSYVDRIDGRRESVFVGSDRTTSRLTIGDEVELRYVPGSTFYMWAEPIEGANNNLLYTAIVLLAIYGVWKVYRRYTNNLR